MFRRSRGLARGNGFLHRLRVAYARSLTFAGLGTGTGFFQLRINANLREEKFQKRFAKSALPRKKHLWRKGFYGRSGILPLHFCYFFSQTQSANGATEHGNTGTRERREREFSHADSADCANFLGGAASCRSIFVIFSRKLQALKARQNTGTRE